jgi:hypothetical protein
VEGLTHALFAQILKHMLDHSPALDLLFHAAVDPVPAAARSSGWASSLTDAGLRLKRST